MSSYMKHTKQELVEIIEKMEARIEKQTLEIAALKEEKEELIRINEQLRCRVGQLEAEYQTLQEEKDALGVHLEKIRTQHREIAEAHDSLRAEFEELQEDMEEREENLNEGYELFKSFVDDNTEKIVLVDAAYSIRYVNKAAAEHFKLASPYEIVNRRIFDFFEFKEALKLKEKIDNTFMKGDREKVKDLTFMNLKRQMFTIRMKMSRVKYQDRPSIKIVFK